MKGEVVSGRPDGDMILAAMQEGMAPAAPPAEPATPALEPEPVAAAAEPAPVAAEVPTSFRSKLRGEEVEVPLYEGSAINPLLVEAVNKLRDYTSGKMALADERRAFEAEMREWRAAVEAEKAKTALADLPELPEDDPYAAHIAAVRKQNEAILEAHRADRESAQAAEMTAARARLDADITRVTTEFKLGEREMNFVGQELYRRMAGGEQVSLDVVAKEFTAWRDGVEESAVRRWKDKHRVDAPPAASAAPVAGTPVEIKTPKSPGFVDDLLMEMGLRK